MKLSWEVQRRIDGSRVGPIYEMFDDGQCAWISAEEDIRNRRFCLGSAIGALFGVPLGALLCLFVPAVSCSGVLPFLACGVLSILAVIFGVVASFACIIVGGEVFLSGVYPVGHKPWEATAPKPIRGD